MIEVFACIRAEWEKTASSEKADEHEEQAESPGEYSVFFLSDGKSRNSAELALNFVGAGHVSNNWMKRLVSEGFF